jgi:dipeptide/tripeptide permease
MKEEFFKKCKVDNILYPNLDGLGNQNFNILWPFIVTIIGIIITVFTFIKTKPVIYGTEKEKQKERPYYIFSLIVLTALTALFGFYGIYLYIFTYLPESNKWLNSLTPDCQTKRESIVVAQAMQNAQDELLRERIRV